MNKIQEEKLKKLYEKFYSSLSRAELQKYKIVLPLEKLPDDKQSELSDAIKDLVGDDARVSTSPTSICISSGSKIGRTFISDFTAELKSLKNTRDERNKAFGSGAVSGALSEQLPGEVGKHIGSFLGKNEAGKTAQTSKTAAKTAREEEEKVIERSTKRPKR